MTGLLRKDLYSLLAYKKTFLLVLAIALAFTLFMPDSASLVNTMLIVYLIQPALGLFSFDDAAKWDTYAAALPVERGAVVKARYLAGILPLVVFVPFSLLLGTAVGALKNIPDAAFTALLTSLVSVCLFLLAMGVSFPIAFKVGVEKARQLMMVTYLLVFAAIMIPLFLFKDTAWLNDITQQTVVIAFTAGLALLLLGLCISFLLSLRIYRKREF